MIKNKGRFIWGFFFLFVICGVVQTASARDMIPPEESVRNTTGEFKQAWRIEAGRKFGEAGLVAANHIVSAIMLTFLIVLLGVLFHLMVKRNHMEQTAERVRAEMLFFYTRMWLINRWGLRF